ncbi:PAS domain S-box protein [Limibacter armeniacum]|uniref:PAS domain S-box protein n=1 Tax=Limibacter armeniacum TaxID=466084 RepID=UPI002FE56FEB
MYTLKNQISERQDIQWNVFVKTLHELIARLEDGNHDWTFFVNYVSKRLAEVTKSSRAGIWMYSESKQTFESISLYDSDRQIPNQEIHLSKQDIPGFFEAFQNGEIIKADRALEHALTTQLAEVYLLPTGIQSVLYIPISYGGKLYGMVGLEFKHIIRMWTAEEVLLLTSTANILSVSRRFQIEYGKYFNLVSDQDDTQATRKNHNERERLDLKEKELKVILDTIERNNYLVRFSPEGVVTYVSEAFLNFVGLTEDVVLGSNAAEFIAQGEETSPEENEEVNRRLGNGEIVEQDLELHVPRGSFWVHVAYSAIISPEGDILEIIGLYTDITELKTHDIALREKNEELLTSEEELRQQQEEILAQQEATEAEKDRIKAILDGCVDAVVTIDGRGTIEYINPSAVKLWGYKPSEVLGQNVKMLMGSEHSTNHDQYLSNYHHTGEKKVIGTGREVELVTKDGRRVPILLTLSEVETSSGKSFTAFVKDITEQKRKEKELREKNEELLTSEEELRQQQEEILAQQEATEAEKDRIKAILDGCVDAVVTIDGRGTIEYINPSAVKLWGYEPSEVLGQNVKMLMGSEHSTNHDQYLSNYHHTGEKKVIGTGREVELVTKDGRRVPILLTLSEVETSSGKSFTAFVKDITVLKQKEAEVLAQQEATEAEKDRIKAILDGCVDAVVTIDGRGTIEYINPSAVKLWGYEPSEVLGQNVKMLMGSEHSTNHDQYLSNYHHTGEKKVIGTGREVELVTKDGRRVPIMLTLSEVETSSGKSFTAFVKDITVLKQKEKELLEKNEELLTSEEELRQQQEEILAQQEATEAEKDRIKAILDGCVDAVVTIDGRGTIEYINPSAVKLWGYEPSEVLGQNVKMLMGSEHSTNHDQYLSNYHHTGEKKVIGTGREVELVTKDGRRVPIMLTLSEVETSSGKSFTAFVKDITVLKQKEKELLEKNEELLTSEEELRQQQEEILAQQEATEAEKDRIKAILDGCVDAVVTIDGRGTIEYINPSAVKLWGYKPSEVLGQNVKMLMGSEHKANHDQYLSNYHQTGEKKVLGTGREVELVTKDGRHVPILLTLSEVVTANGKSFTAFVKDITELKLKETELYEMNEELLTSEEELRQQNEEMIAQKEALAEVNSTLEAKEWKIQQSILAAESIQQAVLPQKDRLDNLLNSYFVLYRPKDIVSGDFYWLRKVENKIVLAVADCTGHGVPGAFMTMIGNSLLDKIIGTEKTLSPAAALESLDREIKHVLRQEETGNTDGMDIALAVMEPIEGGGMRITYGGARNSIYYQQPNESIEKIDGTRRSIGGFISISNKAFTDHVVELAAGSRFYFTTDGFIDQNDENRKSFGKKNFAAMLEDTSHLPIEIQRETVLQHFLNYKEGTEQRDDVLLLGVEVN